MKQIEREFSRLTKGEFRFLQEEFGFADPVVKAFSHGEVILFTGPHCGVKVELEYMGSIVLIWICRLDKGKIRESRPLSQGNDEIWRFALDDIVAIRSPNLLKESLEREKESRGKSFKGILEIGAANLRNVASDVLRGDFGVLKEVELRIQQRAQLR